ncbi:iron-siderophore ABC transporter substrate-binding protein [Phytoactinopolyspora endophytica]|uniref:iron-siderophore ABC transporter substrate-binding protein n=1 Tax=Phytoactinopolyspora endophytica TaxID=1642495 RepID=UPI00101DB2D5|nr:iron-siderophore ABC transporter substrate-binding protein [Phytoactinopolyspora endophytica]
MRFTRIAVIAAGAAALVLAACGSDDTATEGGGSAPDGSADDSERAPDGTFPAVVETKFGEVTIDEQPERVVALGWGDAETALALGVQPVGASDWLAFGGEGVGPWAEGLYDEPPEIIETLEPSYEAVAALQPDLILDVKSSGDQERYDRLSSIATTVGVPDGGDSYLTSPEQQVRMISTALGLAEQGDALLDEVDAAFEAAAAEHPEWQGKTVVAAPKTSEGWGAYVEGAQRVVFLERLGFQQSPTIEELEPGPEGFSVDISPERLDLLDADVVVAFPIYIPTTDITEDRQFQSVPAVADGRSVVIDGDLAAAYAIGTTLATQYAIDGIVPLLADATR